MVTNYFITILTGRMGIIDAGLIEYLESIRRCTEKLYFFRIESVYNTLIPKSHIELFVSELSFVDGILSNEDEVYSALRQGNSRLISLPEGKLNKYSNDRICKKMNHLESKVLFEFEKVLSAEECLGLFGKELPRSKTIGLVSGVFDLIHVNHVRHIIEAHKMIDVLLIATMTSDSIKGLEKNVKGDRPIYSLEERLKVLSSLRSVDYIIVFEESDCRKLIGKIRPDYYIKNKNDYSRSIVRKECSLVEKFGGKVVLIEDGKNYSSTDIINHVRKIRC